jgi:hypothetical protein
MGGSRDRRRAAMRGWRRQPRIDECACAPMRQLQNCTSLNLIQRSMSDYVIHSTAGIIGEVDSMLSRMHSTGYAGASEARVLDNIESTSPNSPPR